MQSSNTSTASFLIFWLNPPPLLFLFLSFSACNSVPPTTEVTTQDEVKVVLLPDSSSVQLNRNSKISFPEEFEGDERNVTLEGEAYFEIKKQSTKRFNVYAGNTKTTVLGTKFGVNAYEDVEEVEVTVYEGKVAFEDVSTQEEEKTQVILEKNDKVVLNKKSRAIKKRKHNGKPLQWLLKNIGKEIKKIGKGIKNAGKELKNSLKKKKED